MAIAKVSTSPELNFCLCSFILQTFGRVTTAFTPVVDGEFISEHPAIFMKLGRHLKIDIMAGITKDEGGLLVACKFNFFGREI